MNGKKMKVKDHNLMINNTKPNLKRQTQINIYSKTQEESKKAHRKTKQRKINIKIYKKK